MTSDTMPIDRQAVLNFLGELRDLETGRCIKDTQQLGEVNVNGDRIDCTIKLTTHPAILRDEFSDQIRVSLQQQFPTLNQVNVNFEPLDRPPPQLGQVGIRVRSLIAVGSGKGGVGKSTVALSLAITLAKSGSRVGILDADVYGPSVPHMLGLNGHPHIFDGRIQPICFENIPVMSMAFLVKPEEAIVWRGPMLHGAINQLLRETNWGDLDYLIVDMPPGTGDVALTLSQTVPVSGAIVVCTPQQVALIDAIRAVSMLNNLEIPVLGIVENMSGFVCPNCHHQTNIFGIGGAKRKSQHWEVPFLGEIPLNLQLQQHTDTGNLSTALADPICSKAIRNVAMNVVRNLSLRATQQPVRPVLPVLQ